MMKKNWELGMKIAKIVLVTAAVYLGMKYVFCQPSFVFLLFEIPSFLPDVDSNCRKADMHLPENLPNSPRGIYARAVFNYGNCDGNLHCRIVFTWDKPCVLD